MAETQHKELSKKLKFWYGFGDFGFTLMTNVETFYFNAFMTNVAGFSTALAGTVSTIASTIDACLSWIYGGLINTLKPGKWGRYRSWLVMLTWLVPFLFIFQFLNVSSNQTVSAVVICVAAVVSHIVWNMPYAANATVVAMAGGTPEGRAALASSRGTWNNLAGVLFSYAVPLVEVIIGQKMVEGGKLYAACAFLFGIVMVAGYFVHFKITDGYEAPEDPNAPKAARTTPADMGRALFGNKHLLLLVLADLAKWIVKFLVASAAVYYFTYAMGTKLQATYVLIANLMGVAGAFAARFIAKKFTNRGAILIAYAWMAILMIVSYICFKSPVLVLVLMCAAQFGYGVCYACSPALYADTAVYAQWKSAENKDSKGFIMGLQTVPLKVAVMIKSIILNLALGLAGYDAYRDGIADKSITADMLPDSLKQGVCGAFSLWSGIFLIVGFCILFFGYKLTKEKVDEYQAEIDARG